MRYFWEESKSIDLRLCFHLIFFCLCLLFPSYGKTEAKKVRKVISVKGRIDLEQKIGKYISLDTKFRDENGKEVALKDMIHKPTILTLVYFTCPGICTPLLNELQKRLEELSLVPGKDFQVVSISFDSRDTYQMAKKKRQNYLKRFRKKKFPPEAWHFLTGTPQSIDKITQEVGFHFRREEKNFRHPGGIIILSPKGKICRYIYGIEYLPADLQMALLKAEKGIAEPAIPKAVIANKTRLSCFVYDPEGKIIGLRISNIILWILFILITFSAPYLMIRAIVKSGKENKSKELSSTNIK